MLRNSLAVFMVLWLVGCGLLPEVKDETKGWSAQRLYTAAKEAMSDGSYDKAVKYYESLEARYPYGRYAQQAQLEVAYAYFKDREPASAIAACDRCFCRALDRAVGADRPVAGDALDDVPCRHGTTRGRAEFPRRRPR